MGMLNIIEKYQGVASTPVIQAVKSAAARTGVDFSFLMEKAAAESSFDPAAKAKTSSASGLYQFIESTWMSMVEKHGDKHGLQEFTKHIETKDGKHCVTDCDVKDKILALRNDPRIAALMAGEFTADNKAYLEKHTEQPVGKTELYFAHFMGAKGGSDFLNARAENGSKTAADIFPKAAKANKNVFFDAQSGNARSLNDVYSFFNNKFDTQPISGGGTPSTQTASLHTHAVPSHPAGMTPAPYIPFSFNNFAGQAFSLFGDEGNEGGMGSKISPFSFLALMEMNNDAHSLGSIRRAYG